MFVLKKSKFNWVWSHTPKENLLFFVVVFSVDFCEPKKILFCDVHDVVIVFVWCSIFGWFWNESSKPNRLKMNVCLSTVRFFFSHSLGCNWRSQRSISILSNFNAFQSGMSNYFQWQQVYQSSALGMAVRWAQLNIGTMPFLSFWIYECNIFARKSIFVNNVMQLENKAFIDFIQCSHQRDFSAHSEIDNPRAG